MTVAEALRLSPFFADLSPWDLETVRAMMALHHYGKGQTLITQGETAEAMFLLLEGRVAVTERDTRVPAARRLQAVEPGEVIGFMSLIDARPHDVSCTAIEDVAVATLSRTAFAMLRTAGAHIAFHLQSCIFRHLQRELLTARGALVRGVFGESGPERVLLSHVVA